MSPLEGKGRREKAPLDAEALSIELLQALRGRRSKPGFAKMLGYKSNIAQRWEAGVCWPTAEKFFLIAARCGVKLAPIVEMFLGRKSEKLTENELSSRAGVARLLTELKGTTPIQAIAARAGYGRFSVSRWCSGKASPKLPEFLTMVEASTGRVVDLVVLIVPPAQLPSIEEEWRRLQAARNLAYENPMTHAVLRGLELKEYQAKGSMKWLASRLGMSVVEVKDAVHALVALDLAAEVNGKYVSREEGVVNTGASPGEARRLRLSWTRAALHRLESGSPGHFGYVLFAVSRETMEEIRGIHASYMRQMSTAIASSNPSECVGLYCAQLLDLAGPQENIFGSAKPSGDRRSPPLVSTD